MRRAMDADRSGRARGSRTRHRACGGDRHAIRWSAALPDQAAKACVKERVPDRSLRSPGPFDEHGRGADPGGPARRGGMGALARARRRGCKPRSVGEAGFRAAAAPGREPASPGLCRRASLSHARLERGGGRVLRSTASGGGRAAAVRGGVGRVGSPRDGAVPDDLLSPGRIRRSEHWMGSCARGAASSTPGGRTTGSSRRSPASRSSDAFREQACATATARCRPMATAGLSW